MKTYDTTAYTFFRSRGNNAQYSLTLARAELFAAARDLAVTWEGDDQPYEDSLGDHEYWCADAKRGKCKGHEVLCAVLRDADRGVAGSLGGIIDPDSAYSREIEAELAAEYMAEVERAAKTQRDADAFERQTFHY